MKFVKLLFILLIVFIICENTMKVYAKNIDNDCNIVQLRAGGGGSSSGGSSGGSSTGRLHGRGNSFSCNHRNAILCVFDYIATLCLLFSMFGIGTFIFYIKVLRSSFNSKKYLKLISQKDVTWKYKNIERQVIDSFYIIQNAWTNMNMGLARDYMDDELYEVFRQKIEWMKIGNKKNVLKRIKLLNIKPISILDDEDNSKDLIWFYIKGSMVDYIINTKTNEIIDGKNTVLGVSFTEYWKFIRKEDKWVLSKILQENEKDKIIFQ